MAQAFSCEDGPKYLKDPKKCLHQYLGPLLFLFIKQIVIKR